MVVSRQEAIVVSQFRSVLVNLALFGFLLAGCSGIVTVPPTPTQGPPTPTVVPPGTAIPTDLALHFSIDDPIRLELVLVPAGEFLMGGYEIPIGDGFVKHEVPLEKRFVEALYVGKYEVTNQEYADFTAVTGMPLPWQFINDRVPSGKANHPVVSVSWREALAFTEWLSTETGLAFRLPTEVEWEKACRGTDGRDYPWGTDKPNAHLANYLNSFGDRADTTPVGAHSPAGDSPYGVSDLAGNVSEWTITTTGDAADANAWRLIKGGSHRTADARELRCNQGGGLGDPDGRYAHVGFRVVLEPPK